MKENFDISQNVPAHPDTITVLTVLSLGWQLPTHRSRNLWWKQDYFVKLSLAAGSFFAPALVRGHVCGGSLPGRANKLIGKVFGSLTFVIAYAALFPPLLRWSRTRYPLVSTSYDLSMLAALFIALRYRAAAPGVTAGSRLFAVTVADPHDPDIALLLIALPAAAAIASQRLFLRYRQPLLQFAHLPLPLRLRSPPLTVDKLYTYKFWSWI